MNYRNRIFARSIALVLLVSIAPGRPAWSNSTEKNMAVAVNNKTANVRNSCSIPIPEPLIGQYAMQSAEQRAQATAWAAINRLSGKEIPSMLYARLSALPKNRRKSLYSTFTGTQKSSVWLIHLSNYEIENTLT
jgi:hypothetical protein